MTPAPTNSAFSGRGSGSPWGKAPRRSHDRLAGGTQRDGQACLPRPACPESLRLPEPRHGATCRRRRKHTGCHRCTAATRCVLSPRGFLHKDALRKGRPIAVVKFAMNFRPQERVNLTLLAVLALGESETAGDLASPSSFGRLCKQNRDPPGVTYGPKAPTASWCW